MLGSALGLDVKDKLRLVKERRKKKNGMKEMKRKMGGEGERRQ